MQRISEVGKGVPGKETTKTKKVVYQSRGLLPTAFSEVYTTDIDTMHNNPLMVELTISTCEVTRVLIDSGSSLDPLINQ